MTVEPRVEDLLASIRKAIDDDIGGLDNGRGANTSSHSQGTLMRSSVREMRVSYGQEKPSKEQADQEISDLRNRISRNRAEAHYEGPIVNSPRTDLNGWPESNAAAGPVLRQTILADAREAPTAYVDQVWDEPSAPPEPAPEPYYPNPYSPQAALVSPQTAFAAQSSFQHLADSIMARAAGDRGIEEITREMLRGMLKQWLDDNLPSMVEKLVREEIERVARRGR